jgi:hypothetical protein
MQTLEVALAGRKVKSICALGGAVEPFKYSKKLPNLEYADLSEAGWKAVGKFFFSGLKKLSRVELPLEVERISCCAFSNATALADIWFPRGLKALEEGAFRNCSALKEISLPPGFKRLSGYSFSYCSSLRRVVLPAAMKKIESNAFRGCAALETLTVGDVDKWEVTLEDTGSAMDSYRSVELKELRLIGQRWETLPADDLSYCFASDARVVGPNFVGKRIGTFVVQVE